MNMSGLVIIVLLLLVLVFLVGAIMVLWAAFKTSILWGIGSFLLAPVYLIFVIMHWQKAKKGFLINLGATIGIFGVIFGAGLGPMLLQGALTADEMPMESPAQELDSEDDDWDVDTEVSEASEEYAQDEEQQVSSADSTSETRVKKITYSYQDVDVSELSSGSINSRVIVTTVDDRTHKGTLIAVSPHRVTVQRKIGSGKFEFEIMNKRIQRIRILMANTQ